MCSCSDCVGEESGSECFFSLRKDRKEDFLVGLRCTGELLLVVGELRDGLERVDIAMKGQWVSLEILVSRVRNERGRACKEMRVSGEALPPFREMSNVVQLECSW